MVLVGSDPASVIYTSKKGEAAIAVGFDHETIRFPETATPQEVREAVAALNKDRSVDGILIQRPLPKSFREEEVVMWVDPTKDVDAFHPENAGRLQLGLPCLRPCTPAGILELLKHYQIEIAGRLACVIGRSSIVGKPMASILLSENATLLHCHSKTKDLAKISSQADILVVAIGQPEKIDKSYVKKGATVIDVGIHRKVEGGLCGDVLYSSVIEVAGACTPVPGGVGPMTITMLLSNTLEAARKREC